MVNRKIDILVFLFVTLAVTGAPATGASVTIHPTDLPLLVDATYVSQHGNHLTLDGDWAGSAGNAYALLITAPDVVLDGGDHLISGTLDSVPATSQDGVMVNARNVTVKNLRVSGWDLGIAFRNANDGLIVNITGNNNKRNGVYVDRSDRTRIRNVTANGNYGPYGTGIDVVNSVNIITEECIAGRNTIKGIGNNNVADSVIRDNTADILVDGGCRNITIDGNRVPGAPDYKIGIFVIGSQEVNSFNNTATGTDQDGITYQRVNGGSIINNTIRSTNLNGIGIDLSSRIILERNHVHDNLKYRYATGILAVDSQYIYSWHNDLTGNYAGVTYSRTTDSIISDNDAGNNTEFGIGVYVYSSNITIDNNEISNITHEIWGDGINVENSSRITIVNNRIHGASSIGIMCYNLSEGLMVNNTLWNNGLQGISTDKSFNITIENNTADNIVSIASRQINILNNMVQGSGVARHITGIDFQWVSGGWIFNNTVTNHPARGINLYGSSQVTVEKNGVSGITSDSGAAGICSLDSWNNKVIDNSVHNNRKGILINYNVTGLQVKGNSIFDNSADGMYIYGSDTHATTITGNRIYANGGRGITLYLAGPGHQIYNNYFNNTQNFVIVSSSPPNIWNTSKTSGRNIVDGPFLGGNYWANPTGTGFSQITPDTNGDGICDSPYILASGNADYLPLADAPSIPATKIGIFKDGNWYMDVNGDGFFTGYDRYIPYGTSGWIRVVGDWNGDGVSEIGIYKDGVWYLDYGGSGEIDADTRYYAFGATSWTPLVGDWDGNGCDEIGVYQDGNWYLDYNGNGYWDTGDKNHGFGAPGWLPVPGKWTDDAKTKIGIYNSGNWYIDRNGDGLFIPATGDRYIPYGTSGWTGLVGDWNGDGVSEIGIYSESIWYLDYGGSGVIDADTKYYAFGSAGWTPVTGDWNGDGTEKIGVYQNGNWYLDYDGNGYWSPDDRNYAFGAQGWTPVVGKWGFGEG